MTNIDRAAEVLWLPEPHLFTSECDDQARELAQALADAGLLAPDLQIIRTVEELDTLDPLTVVYVTDRDTPLCAGDFRDDIDYDPYYANDLPAAVIATAEQVRAARKALKEATE